MHRHRHPAIAKNHDVSFVVVVFADDAFSNATCCTVITANFGKLPNLLQNNHRQDALEAVSRDSMAMGQASRGRAESSEWSGNPYRLTAREQRIASLLAEQLSVEQAVARLDLAPGVFRAALARLVRKTGAHNLAHLNHIIATLDRLSDHDLDQGHSQPGHSQPGQSSVRPAIIQSECLAA